MVEEDDDDVDSYFAYSSDDMLQSKVASSTSGDSSILAAGQVSETSIPNFLLKLWKLVDDNRYKQCIGWDSSGFSFHVRDPYGFSKDVLPLYFKHSNLNSFIRQLNMYGFRKVTNLEKGALKQQSEHESLEFQHPYFVRGHPELLQYIKRKISNPRSAAELDVQHHGSVRGMNQMLEELRQLREKQLGMDAKLNQVKKENGTLWREVAHMRQLHMKQQQVVNKLIQFLLSLVQPAAGKRLGKRRLLAIGPSLLVDQQLQDSEQPAKRLRSGSISSHPGACHIIESLEQELQNSDRSPFGAPANVSVPVSGGPIIADVTDEPEHYFVDEPRQDAVVSTAMQSQTIAGVPTVFVQPTPPAALERRNPDVGLTTAAPCPGMDSRLVGSSGGHGRCGGVEPDKFPNMVMAPGVSSIPTSQKPASPQAAQLQHLYTPDVAPVQQPRAISNRSISSNDGAMYDWTVRSNHIPDGDESKWSKPEFSDYLDFVQTDLDSLRDFLTSGSFNVDQDSLSSLFAMADETSAVASSPQLPGTEVIGNEIQLYKRPELLVNLDDRNGSPNNYRMPTSSTNRVHSNRGAAIEPTVTTPAISMPSPTVGLVAQAPGQLQGRRVSNLDQSPGQLQGRRISNLDRVSPSEPLPRSIASHGVPAASSGLSNVPVGQPGFILHPTQGAMAFGGVPQPAVRQAEPHLNNVCDFPPEKEEMHFR